MQIEFYLYFPGDLLNTKVRTLSKKKKSQSEHNVQSWNVLWIVIINILKCFLLIVTSTYM